MNLEEYFNMLQKMEQQNNLHKARRKGNEGAKPPTSADDTQRR